MKWGYLILTIVLTCCQVENEKDGFYSKPKFSLSPVYLNAYPTEIKPIVDSVLLNSYLDSGRIIKVYYAPEIKNGNIEYIDSLNYRIEVESYSKEKKWFFKISKKYKLKQFGEVLKY